MKNVQIKILLISLLLGSCNSTCSDEVDVSFAFPINISDREVYMVIPMVEYWGTERLINGLAEEEYTDVYPIPKENVQASKSVFIEDWENVFSFYKVDTLALVFLDIDTIQKYGWDKVRTDYKILARYDLTMENIIDLGGIVPYPLQDSTVKIYYPEGLNPFEPK